MLTFLVRVAWKEKDIKWFFNVSTLTWYMQIHSCVIDQGKSYSPDKLQEQKTMFFCVLDWKGEAN
jgi:hypothetical protein